jgi:hypothetical protein
MVLASTSPATSTVKVEVARQGTSDLGVMMTGNFEYAQINFWI